jgi:acyl-CoA synthetase (AMP-forming)/AMP-acid ligase II
MEPRDALLQLLARRAAESPDRAFLRDVRGMEPTHTQFDDQALIEFLLPTMPRFMVPHLVEFVDALPKTEATMRVQKSKLRDDPLNDATWDHEAAGLVLPRCTAER